MSESVPSVQSVAGLFMLLLNRLIRLPIRVQKPGRSANHLFPVFLLGCYPGSFSLGCGSAARVHPGFPPLLPPPPLSKNK